MASQGHNPVKSRLKAAVVLTAIVSVLPAVFNRLGEAVIRMVEAAGALWLFIGVVLLLGLLLMWVRWLLRRYLSR